LSWPVLMVERIFGGIRLNARRFGAERNEGRFWRTVIVCLLDVDVGAGVGEKTVVEN
jgi:hypothetical protein